MMRAALVEPEDPANKDSFSLWIKETLAALVAIESKASMKVWKVAGKYEVIALMKVEDSDSMTPDQSEWMDGFAHMVSDVEWTHLRDYKSWRDQLKETAEAMVNK